MISLVLSGMKVLILLSSPMCWLIFVEILFKWSDQVRFSEKVIPRYLKVRSRASWCSLTCMDILVNDFRRLLLPNRTNLDFLQFNVSKFWSSHWEIMLRSSFTYFSMSLTDLDELYRRVSKAETANVSTPDQLMILISFEYSKTN